MNSKLINNNLKLILSSELHVYPEAVRNVPMHLNERKNQQDFVYMVAFIISKTKEVQNVTIRSHNCLKSYFFSDKLTKKLQKWYELEFGDSIKELDKAIKKIVGEKLSKIDKMEWLHVFVTKKVEAQKLKVEIDKEIDAMVYKLYHLTEEIQIVKNS